MPSSPERPTKAAPARPTTGGKKAGRDLPLPHERDESSGDAGNAPRPEILQAKRDIDAGLVDTDMRATPGLDAELRARLVPTPPPPRR